ncbi:hypothetical protein P8452_16734 [Trifolium repens]|nr:hypothetical protein P8452_16734 [Trifolium repens]
MPKYLKPFTCLQHSLSFLEEAVLIEPLGKLFKKSYEAMVFWELHSETVVSVKNGCVSESLAMSSCLSSQLRKKQQGNGLLGLIKRKKASSPHYGKLGRAVFFPLHSALLF